MAREEVTKITDDGLRYKSKRGGRTVRWTICHQPCTGKSDRHLQYTDGTRLQGQDHIN
jgi:hypothetical protein